jgi:hypothetical protein
MQAPSRRFVDRQFGIILSVLAIVGVLLCAVGWHRRAM